ncbi:MAG: type II 3-dehydroquinate dehydratase [Candidatus Eremiobacterota bacterium]
MRALILNGPNLNLLGVREPEVYGRTTFAELERLCRAWAEELGLQLDLFQSNHEGALLDRLHEAIGKVDFGIVNPGALTHTSIALRDAIAGVGIPIIEVHLSNIYAREEWRRRSVISEVCRGVISGLGVQGYRLALQAGPLLTQG